MTSSKLELNLATKTIGRFRRNAGRIHSGTAVGITAVPLVGFTGIASSSGEPVVLSSVRV
jgi:hypothetical protein